MRTLFGHLTLDIHLIGFLEVSTKLCPFSGYTEKNWFKLVFRHKNLKIALKNSQFYM